MRFEQDSDDLCVVVGVPLCLFFGLVVHSHCPGTFFIAKNDHTLEEMTHCDLV